MALLKSKIRASEGSSVVLLIEFKELLDGEYTDESVTPDSVFWSLTDKEGTVINSRLDVAVTPPESTITIVLAGEDLALSGEASNKRYLTIYGEYSSLSLGPSIPYREQIEFQINNLVDPN